MAIEDELAKIPQLFADFLATRGLVYDVATQVDMLASALGSQFVLFAGPSGTGKSTAAKALAEFFTSGTRISTVDARPAWTSIEDLAGQYSTFASAYVAGPGKDALVGLDGSGEPPVLIVEEANLSPIEAYLGPVVTTASSIAFEELLWPLHTWLGKIPEPASVTLAKWPRIFGTVNVDSTAEAPAPKVSGRACVVLLEPPLIETALASTSAIRPAPDLVTSPAPGATVFGDPRAAWDAFEVNGAQSRLADALRGPMTELARHAGRGMNVVSPRDLQRCVTYMSWHIPLADAAVKAGLLASTSDVESAENAILHFVLPGLSADQFGRSVEPLDASATAGGLLKKRLGRLAAGGESLFGVAPDFWASLS